MYYQYDFANEITFLGRINAVFAHFLDHPVR